MIMIVKTPGSQMGSPAASEEGGEEMGGEKCESGERREVHSDRRTTREIEKFIIRQPPKGEKDGYDSENSWISVGLPAAADKGGEEMGGEKCVSGERREVGVEKICVFDLVVQNI